MTWLLAAGAQAQKPTFNDKLPTENSFPSELGPDDEAGAIARIMPAVVMKAMKLVKQGRTAARGKLYASDIPAFGTRAFLLSIQGTPTGGPFRSNMLVHHGELATTEIGQIGTQRGGPGHIGVRTSKCGMFHNGRYANEISQRGGTTRVMRMGDPSVEHVAEKAHACRGVLPDGPRRRCVNPLPIPRDTKSPGIITSDDVKTVMKKGGLEEIRCWGDCVPLYTGHGDPSKNGTLKGSSVEEKAKRRAIFTSGEPGFGRSACESPASPQGRVHAW